MGIQYVTVRVDTTGLYQPVSAAVGVVGIIGAAPSAGAGFDNPTLCTRALTGADSEPYARVVPVIRVGTAAPFAPLDATGAAIANTGWQQPKDSKGNVIGPFQLVDTAAATFSPLSVDTATRTLRRASGAVFRRAARPRKSFSTTSRSSPGPLPLRQLFLGHRSTPRANRLPISS